MQENTLETVEKDKKRQKLVKEAEKYREKLNKRGVIYMSRVPPFMKPNKVRNIFEQYGNITRLYLSEEDPELRKKRRNNGGNGSRQFNEGWIEFEDRSIAKKIAMSLNNTPIGGKKSDFYHDDIWNLKYLKNFKWDYLTEKFAYEKRVRESKLKLAMIQSKKANAEIAEQLERTKVQKIIQERKRKREITEAIKDKSSLEADAQNSDSKEHFVNLDKKARKFRQNRKLGENYGEHSHKVNNKLLAKIFSKD